MGNNKTNIREFWGVVGQNLSTIVTILAAVVALVLSQLNLISAAVLPGVTIGLLALIAISHLIDSRRLLTSLSGKVDSLAQEIRIRGNSAEIRRFDTAEDAIGYLIWRTKAAKKSVEQASIDKQRARSTPLRKQYEKAREDLIQSDTVKYRYIGLINEERQFRSVKDVLEKKVTHNFYAAFQYKPEKGFPLLNFVIFDKEEVFSRAPYSIGEDPVYISVRCKEIAELFGGYFEKIWNSATKIENVDTLKELLHIADTRGKK